MPDVFPVRPYGFHLPWHVLFAWFFTVNLLLSHTLARDLPDIYWNSTNPMFRIDNTDHVMTAKIADKVNIVCPYYNDTLLVDPAILTEGYVEIYRVSQQAYDYCDRARDPDARIVGVCSNPFVPGSITFRVREFTPIPRGLEFQPWQKYYFISTSTGDIDGIQNEAGGLCHMKNMKVLLDVRPRDDDISENAGNQPTRWSTAPNITPKRPSHPSEQRTSASSSLLSKHENGDNHLYQSGQQQQSQSGQRAGVGDDNGKRDPYSGLTYRLDAGQAASDGPGALGSRGVEHASYIITEEYYPKEFEANQHSAGHRGYTTNGATAATVLNLVDCRTFLCISLAAFSALLSLFR